jgi:hypothetical protein
MNKLSVFFSIVLLTSPLAKASEPELIEVTIIEAPVAQYAQIVDAPEPQQAEVVTLPEPETAVFIEATKTLIPGNVFCYEEGDFTWSEWAEKWDAILFDKENVDALESAQEFGLTVGTVEKLGVLYTIVILDTENKENIENWLANQ